MSRYSKSQLEAMDEIEQSVSLKRAIREAVDQALGTDPSKSPNGPSPSTAPDPAKQKAALEKLRSIQAAGLRIL